MVKEEIVGTYWYVINNGRRWITQGNKPTPYEGYFQRSGPGMGWLCLDIPDQERVLARKGETIVSSQDFAGLKFPEVDPETPVEIEIVKSKKVFVYES